MIKEDSRTWRTEPLGVHAASHTGRSESLWMITDIPAHVIAWYTAPAARPGAPALAATPKPPTLLTSPTSILLGLGELLLLPGH